MGFLSWIGEKGNHNKALSLHTHRNALGMGYGKGLPLVSVLLNLRSPSLGHKFESLENGT